MTGNGQLDRMEALLRRQRGVELSQDFRSGVLEAIGRLPAPELVPATPRPRLLLWLASGLLTLLLGVAALALPHYSATLAAWQWELSELSVAVSFGEAALSASLLSVIYVGVGAAMLTALSVYGRRNHLLGA